MKLFQVQKKTPISTPEKEIKIKIKISTCSGRKLAVNNRGNHLLLRRNMTINLTLNRTIILRNKQGKIN